MGFAFILSFKLFRLTLNALQILHVTMKTIVPLVAVSSMMLLRAAGASIGPRLTKKTPDPRGVVLAGGHRVHPHARRTTAKIHSKVHHPAPDARRTTTMAHSKKKGNQKHASQRSRHATASTHTKKDYVTLDEPLRAATRGGLAAAASGGRVGVKASEPGPAPAPTPVPKEPSPGAASGGPTLDPDWGANFDIFFRQHLERNGAALLLKMSSMSLGGLLRILTVTGMPCSMKTNVLKCTIPPHLVLQRKSLLSST